MKELAVFIIIFSIVFILGLIVFNGRFIYAEIKYYTLGPSPVSFSSKGRDEAVDENVANIAGEKREKTYPQRIIIAPIGVDAPVVLPEGGDKHTLYKALERGVVYWPGSSTLNEGGAIVILGHSSAYPWYKGSYGSIFSLLNKLNPGDNILIVAKEKKYTYQVVEKQIELPKNLNFYQDKDQSVLYLVSCWPINTNWKRIVVKAVKQ